MIKRLTITLFLVFSYLSASAQMVTPQLNRTADVLSPAAVGWRDGSTAGIIAASAEGNKEDGGVETGDVTIGGTIPAFMLALKGEEAGLEIYLSTDKVLKSENSDGSESETKLPETRLNLAYVFGETFSVGLGYRVSESKEESKPDSSNDADDKETGTTVSASLKLAEIFYITAGMENVTNKYSGTADYDTSWSNTSLGVGMLVGDPGESRFRAEYAITQSPEEKTDHPYGSGWHYKTDQTFMSVEALFGDFLLSYISETTKVSDKILGVIPGLPPVAVTGEDKTVVTLIGLGWMPEEGFSVAVYSLDYKRTIAPDLGSEIEVNPKGYRIDLGWNF